MHTVVARSTFRSQNVQNTTCSRHFWRFRCRFAWQEQGIVHLVKSDQNVRVLSHFFRRVWTWERPKRNKSARRLHFLNLTTSETKQFCETSSCLEVQDIKNEEFCETSFKNGKLSAELTDSYQCVLRFFQSTCLKYCACHGKLMPGHTKCCACHAKSS